MISKKSVYILVTWSNMKLRLLGNKYVQKKEPSVGKNVEDIGRA